ncbi:ABC transporter permease [Rhodanobacter sp. C03]|uniref:ABC transporter permease n=1 Tax=Rhodanobacter sp. C03 TaxID=1945858 RepID=UPI000985D953|nr:ABC transporter permease [Rhodanobacter sp. C03]OOG59837.1 ABC transporter ATP-binding protein [Rhodanobacter sp. C03]
MFGYYLDLALRSLRRNQILTALMVLAIGLGIGASMTMMTVLHVMSADPIPDRSGQLFYPHLDPTPLDRRKNALAPDPTDNMTWPDAMALLAAHRGTRQAAMSGGNLVAHPEKVSANPFTIDGRYTTADFFAMFRLRFVAGHAWTATDDTARSRVVVLSEALSRTLFGTDDSAGRMVQLGEHTFRVIGVTAPWAPQPMFYADAAAHKFGESDQFFLPLATAVDLKLDTSGNVSSWKKFSGDLTASSVTWLQFWVQLDKPDQVAAYRRFLFDYSAQQKALGVYERPADSARLDSLRERLVTLHLVPDDLRLQSWLALGFLMVCMVNIVALLLAKFLRRSGEVSVRRALGAQRRDIFVQFGVESALIGLVGGGLGLLLAQLGLWGIRRRPDEYAQLAQMDTAMLLSTFALAVVASVLAGLLPAWRACHIAPALQLKTL